MCKIEYLIMAPVPPKDIEGTMEVVIPEEGEDIKVDKEDIQGAKVDIKGVKVDIKGVKVGIKDREVVLGAREVHTRGLPVRYQRPNQALRLSAESVEVLGIKVQNVHLPENERLVVCYRT